MDIVLLGADFAMTGASLLLERWAVHLVRNGHSVIAVPASDMASAVGPLRASYQAAGIPVQASFHVGPEMLVICNTVLAAPYVIQTAPTARTIWWIHEAEIGLELAFANPKAVHAFRSAHALIFPSVTIRDRVYGSYLLNVPPQRLHVVPPGLEPPGPTSTESEPVPPNRPVRVICVGSIYPRKRQADLIRAVANLRDVPLECLLIGQMVNLDPEAAEIAKAAPDRFAFAGQLPHVETLRRIGRADILVLPSSSECLPIAPLEAAQRGKAVLLSDLPAHEGIWRHGINCLMHPVGDVDLMTHLLRMLANDAALRSRLGAAARLVAAPYRNDVFLARLDLVMQGLL